MTDSPLSPLSQQPEQPGVVTPIQASPHKTWYRIALAAAFFVLVLAVAVFFFLPKQKATQDTQEALSSPLMLSALDDADYALDAPMTEYTAPAGQESVAQPEIATQQQPSPQPTPAPAEITLLFVGDMMFDRTIRIKMQRHELGTFFPLKQLEPYFQQFDYVIGNLEGPVTDKPSRSVGSEPGSTNNFFFTFQPEIAQTLYEQNLRIVNLGNNHILNFGTDGVRQTKEYLSQANVRYFGDTSTETTSDERTIVVDHEGFKLGFVGYNQFIKDGLPHALEDIAWIKPQVDFVIVYPHWGNEYVPTANAAIVKMAHQLVDQGADLVIGAHPHVIQNVEEYNNVRIYYSLGNFVFDQYFSKEVQEGMMVEVTIDPATKALQFTEKRVQLRPDGSTIMKDTPSPSPQAQP
jgi:poly-gamma-glutamate synthesis protein (capsule biosynthesis protein)